MAQLPQRWRSGNGEIAWLSMLVMTFEKLSDPEERARPCDPDVLAAAKAHLALPARFQSFYGSRFSLRN
jgi:hypothetical protein